MWFFLCGGEDAQQRILITSGEKKQPTNSTVRFDNQHKWRVWMDFADAWTRRTKQLTNPRAIRSCQKPKTRKRANPLPVEDSMCSLITLSATCFCLRLFAVWNYLPFGADGWCGVQNLKGITKKSKRFRPHTIYWGTDCLEVMVIKSYICVRSLFSVQQTLSNSAKCGTARWLNADDKFFPPCHFHLLALTAVFLKTKELDKVMIKIHAQGSKCSILRWSSFCPSGACSVVPLWYQRISQVLVM